jgi:hypothetical protein
MTEHNLAPIELTDDELLAVSGGIGEGGGRISTSASISQRVHQDVAIAQLGGNVIVGGGNGATTVTNATFSESFSASASATATNTNNGSATATTSGGSAS